MGTLFEIGEDLEAIESLLYELDGDISDPEAAEAIEVWFAEFQQNQGKKIDGYLNLIRKWEAEAAAAKAEIDQYRKRAQVRENRVDAFKARLKLYMETTNQKKIETPTGRAVSIQANGGKVPLWVDENVRPESLEPRFQKITVAVNNDAIRTAIDAGEALSFARLGQRGTQLRVR